MGIVLTNNAESTLAANISSTDTVFYITDTDSFPSLDVDEYFYATVESTTGAFEIVKVTQVNSGSFNVVRAQENTIAIPFNIGARVEQRITAQSITDKFDDAVEAHISDTAYGVSWNGDTDAPTKNTVYDKVELIVTDITNITSDITSIDALLDNITRGATYPTEGDLFTALGANFLRTGERTLIGGYATAYKGTNTRSDGASFLGSTLGGYNAFWQERSAQFGSLSLHGGIGVLGGARKSDRYRYTDGVTYPVWITATVYAAGAIVGSRGKFYQTAAGGTSGVTPPSHTTGDASDGAVTWTFLDYSYTAPIGIAGSVLSDVVDGSGAWAAYFEAVRTSVGGTTYGTELDVGNEGGDITNNPYSITPAGATIGHWVAAGRSASTPANPSTNAILIGKNNQTWNSGIVFEYQGITSGGYAIKYAAITDHAQGWFNSSGQEVFALYSTATANNERTKIVSGNSKIEFYSVGGVMATISSGATAGTAANEHINLIAYPAGTGYATVTPHGTSPNLGLRLLAKGTENVYVSGVALRPITNDGTSLGTAAAAWSDAEFANGAVIRFNNAYTLTHSTGLLTANGAFSIGTSNVFTAGTIELGAASDTTLSRASAGKLAVEGVTLLDTTNISDTAYDTTSWDGVTTIAPSKNAIRDKFASLAQADILGLTTADSPQFTGINLGNASDTTLSRSAAGILAVEGVDVLLVSGAQTVSGAKTFSATPIFSNTTTGLSINNTSPRILWTDSDATATQQVWDMVASNASWLFRTRTDADGAGSTIMTVTRSGTGIGGITFGGPITASVGTAIPAGGTAGVGLRVSSATNFGVFFGSGAPTLSAAKGSLYLRSDGSTTNDRMYVNTDGSTTWTAVTTVA